MPILNGLEATKIIESKIKEKDICPLNIVGLTAKNVSSKMKEKMLELGMKDVFVKPIFRN